ncbi:hypothetical protein [Flavobacterium chungnamense]|uniref:YD repeat-containing protein n=1 Tax=Flavobacterium chungnamense TaxID=706182 RepID=A0ABP7UYM3_9FLAO
MKYCLTLLFTLASLLSFSQNDEIKGLVKSVREKVIFKKYEKKVEEFVDDEGNIIRRTYLPDFGVSRSPYGNFFKSPDLIISGFPKTWYYNNNSIYKNYFKSFSKTGKKVLEKWYEHDNEVIDTIEFKYDIKDSLILRTEKDYDISFEERTYNNSGLESILYTTKFDNEINIQKVKFTYNEKNKVIRRDYFRDSIYDSSTFYKYNDKGSIVEESEFQSLEKIHSKSIQTDADFLNIKGYSITYLENKYDENNKIIQINKYKSLDRKAFLNSSTFYNYEGNKLIITTKKFNNANISINELEYKNNLLINERYFNRGKAIQLKSFFYNKDNYLVKAIIKDREELYNIEFKYKFDRKGNWIKQTKYVNGVPTYELIREIEYY